MGKKQAGKKPQPHKRLVVNPERLEPLVPAGGVCYASDRIVVDGRKVGYLYREDPNFDADSGWRFMAGDETPEYLDQPRNFGIYEVNLVANCDRTILECLDAPVSTAFEWDEDAGNFVEVDFEDEADEQQDDDEEEEADEPER